MDADRVEQLLHNWEVWMQHCTMPGRYASRASGGLRGYGTQQSWEVDNELDRQAGANVDAVVEELPERLKIAVYVTHEIRAAVFWLRGNLDDAYAEACIAIGKALDRRGIP